MYYSKLGAEIKLTKPLTRNDFAQICKIIDSKISEYDVCPEGITEGGIEFKSNKGYKSARLYVYRCHNAKYPWVDHLNPYDVFEGSDEIWIPRRLDISNRCKYINSIAVYLKSYEDNKWTNIELKSIIDAFNKYGCKSYKIAKLK